MQKPLIGVKKLNSKPPVNSDDQKAQADALFHSIGDGVITTDEEGRITRINNVALQLLGLKEKDVIGQWFPATFIALDADGAIVDPLERPILQAILTGKPVSRKTSYLTPTGRQLPVAVTVSPIISDNKPLGAVEIFRDIAQEQEIDRMKSEFISIASHQLRTPLTAIKTYAHLLSSGYRGKLNTAQQEFMQIILSSIDRMNELINILLDVSRIEAGKIQIVLKETDLHDMVGAIVEGLQQEARNKNINLKLKGKDTPLIATIDQILTSEVISNLLINAIKYTQPGGNVEISVDETANEIIVVVRDNGYGIPKELHAKVFTKFFRADNVRQREPSGTGLGLYMVKQIIENMGGKIGFESRENKGTVFKFTVPKKPNTPPSLIKTK